jgi:AcrR family transcriptional regulator
MSRPTAPAPRLRAIDDVEKAARREAIVDAASSLYERALELPGVADVAAEAGLAKGTMYLYFETKEAIYLALHQRHTQRFFEALIAHVEDPAPFDLEAMLAIVDEHMIRDPAFLPLSHVCLGAAPDRIDERSHEAFHLALGAWMQRAGAGLERRLPRLVRGDGVRFLHQGYALLLGLYQLLGQASQCAAFARMRAAHAEPALCLIGDFRTEAHAALRDLWLRADSHGLSPAADAPKPHASPRAVKPHTTPPRATTKPHTTKPRVPPLATKHRATRPAKTTSSTRRQP